MTDYEVIKLGNEWWVDGPDDENNAGPFPDEATALAALATLK